MTIFSKAWKALFFFLSPLALTFACGIKPAQESQNLQSITSQPTPDSAKSFPIINEQITLTIAEKLAAKCRVLYPSTPTDLSSCTAASASLAKELDFTYIRRKDGNSAFVFFGSRLQSLLAEKAVADYLNQVQKASLDAVYANQRFNLWDFTVSHCQGNEALAAERIAVLFQDGLRTSAQLNYLLVQQHPMAIVLGQTLEALESGLNQGKIIAYPKDVQSPRTALYHYYVPRFLALRLSQVNRNRAMSARISIVFNSIYELRQIQKSQNPDISHFHTPVNIDNNDNPQLKEFVSKWNRFDELYSDLLDHLSAPLNSFDPRGQEDNLQDLYLGYAGGLQGSRSGSAISNLRFATEFAQNPQRFLLIQPAENIN